MFWDLSHTFDMIFETDSETDLNQIPTVKHLYFYLNYKHTRLLIDIFIVFIEPWTTLPNEQNKTISTSIDISLMVQKYVQLSDCRVFSIYLFR